MLSVRGGRGGGHRVRRGRGLGGLVACSCMMITRLSLCGIDLLIGASSYCSINRWFLIAMIIL